MKIHKVIKIFTLMLSVCLLVFLFLWIFSHWPFGFEKGRLTYYRTYTTCDFGNGCPRKDQFYFGVKTIEDCQKLGGRAATHTWSNYKGCIIGLGSKEQCDKIGGKALIDETWGYYGCEPK